MNWRREPLRKVKEFVDKMNSDPSFYDENIESLRCPVLDEPYATIRNELKTSYDLCMRKYSNKEYETRSQEYGVDLEMAGAIYSILNRYGFTPKDASDQEIWLYFNRRVIPDIIIDRFKNSATERRPKLSPDRFFENQRRYYMSMLWWFIFISWQETNNGFQMSLDRTLDMLKKCQSDDISQLIVRAGIVGYPLTVYKEIMKQYCDHCLNGTQTDGLLSKVLQLNIIYMVNTEPDLIETGLPGYVSDLFYEVMP